MLLKTLTFKAERDITVLIPKYFRNGIGPIKNETDLDNESISVDRIIRIPRNEEKSIFAGRIHEELIVKINPF